MKDFFFESADDAHRKREKNKARELRRSPWWKNRLAESVCYYCKERFSTEELTMDHRVPISRGGKTTRNNVVVSCKKCNGEKKYHLASEITLDRLQKE